MLKDFITTLEYHTKKPYDKLEIEIVFFEDSFIRTSFGDDGNNGDWNDEDAI